MNLGDAIKHALEKAGSCESACAQEHHQLATWLQELKSLKTPLPVQTHSAELVTPLVLWHVSEKPDLSMLNIAGLMYLSNTPRGWHPSHLKTKHYVYEVQVRLTRVLQFASHNDYINSQFNVAIHAMNLCALEFIGLRDTHEIKILKSTSIESTTLGCRLAS